MGPMVIYCGFEVHRNTLLGASMTFVSPGRPTGWWVLPVKYPRFCPSQSGSGQIITTTGPAPPG